MSPMWCETTRRQTTDKFYSTVQHHRFALCPFSSRSSKNPVTTMTTRQRDNQDDAVDSSSDNHNNSNNNSKKKSAEQEEKPGTKRRRLEEETTTTKSSFPPKKKKILWDVPSSSHYEVSYMHRRVVTRLATSLKHGYVLSGSEDGIVKFWKRLSSSAEQDDNPNSTTRKTASSLNSKCLEFVKSFTAHVGPIFSLCVSHSGDTACSVGQDGILKFYDISTFDVSGMIRIDKSKFKVGMHSTFVGENYFACVVNESLIHIYDTLQMSPEPIHICQLHASPITSMTYNPLHHVMVSGDQKGTLEVWNCQGGGGTTIDSIGKPPTLTHNGINYKSKMDTQLYDLMKKKTFPIAMATSPLGTHFVVYGADRKIRVYHHATGKIVVTYDERAKVYEKAFQKLSSLGDDSNSQTYYGMDAMDYGKRASTEREMDDTLIMTGGVRTDQILEDDTESGCQLLTISFDPSGQYLIIPTLVGLKVIDFQTHKLQHIVAKGDAHLCRFTTFCICAGDAKVNTQMQLARSGGSSTAMNHDKGNYPSDALLVLLAYKKRRLYVVSHTDPVQEEEDTKHKTGDNDDGGDEDILVRRDILNEPPDADDRLLERPSTHSQKSKGASEAILRTSMGDVHIKLFTSQVPKTIENFVGHAKNKYYDNVIFHRIIKGFMLQTGDPLGDGTGGESIWGGEFEDEFVRDLRHDRPFTVSMANAGPSTNGSQFFITTVPTPWLDNKHTVFGRVTKGMDICTMIENAKTDDMDKPLEEISILSVDVV